ncbi:IS110 family transposase [Caballeronia sp. S22]|uniref:IS110 family transposase n=1 Tax=Caballeronia sp. S22 TaxID=3137182 RepID=UPI00353107EA
MNTPGMTRSGQDAKVVGSLYVAFELGDRSWNLCLGDGVCSPSRCTVAAGDTAAVLKAIARAKVRCRLPDDAPVRSCYEAGRDGFWLHRWASAHGISNLVVDPASIEVSRRARRAKTDRLDADRLLAMLMRYHAGERRLWAIARIPSPEQEDERRVHRELGRLRQERTAHSNRVRSLLVLHNLRTEHIGGRTWGRWWAEHAAQLLPDLRAEIERELERLALVARQIRTLETMQAHQVRNGEQPAIAGLARLAGIGTGSAWTLVKELFGWRRFGNRRELAGCLGLAPTPYASGTSEAEQGISKAGNKRVRWLMVELAWSWLRFQPASELSKWFNQRFSDAGKRSRRIGIVALARRLAIAIWRYLEHGEIPAGARLKPVAAAKL